MKTVSICQALLQFIAVEAEVTHFARPAVRYAVCKTALLKALLIAPVCLQRIHSLQRRPILAPTPLLIRTTGRIDPLGDHSQA